MFEPRLTYVYLVGAAMFWGLGTVLSKYALGGIDASLLLPFQLACSVLLLGAFLLVTRSSLRGISRSAQIAALGVLNPGIAYAIGLIALAHINASVSVIIWATEPVVIVVLAFSLLHERLPLWSIACLAAAMAGVALIVGTPSTGNSTSGVVLTFASVFACALYSVLLRRMNLTDGTLPVVFLQQASALGFAVVVLFVVSRQSFNSVDATALQQVSAILSGGVYYGVAFLLFVSGLRRTSAARAGMSLTLIPVFGLFFSALLLGETMRLSQFVGSSLVVGSMAFLGIREARETQKPSEPQPKKS
jgi:drug/metabolite transporter (DMT)-like permease